MEDFQENIYFKELYEKLKDIQNRSSETNEIYEKKCLLIKISLWLIHKLLIIVTWYFL